MTYESEVEVRRSSVGTKVLGVAVGVLGVLGSFWGVVWFIRSYVEAPRVNAPAPMMLASRESTPVAAPAAPRTEIKADVKAEAAASAPAPAATPAPAAQMAAATPQPPELQPSSAIAERWFSGNQFGLPGVAPAPPAPPPPVAAAPVAAAPTVEAQPVAQEEAAAEPADPEPAAEDVAESSVPAISGPAPLPRRRPLVTAAVKRVDTTTPLPRPRPDGPAPQSVWTGVPSGDERFAGQQ